VSKVVEMRYFFKVQNGALETTGYVTQSETRVRAVCLLCASQPFPFLFSLPLNQKFLGEIQPLSLFLSQIILYKISNVAHQEDVISDRRHTKHLLFARRLADAPS